MIFYVPKGDMNTASKWNQIIVWETYVRQLEDDMIRRSYERKIDSLQNWNTGLTISTVVFGFWVVGLLMWIAL